MRCRKYQVKLSNKYDRIDMWVENRPVDTPYRRRILRLHEKHPEATLSQLRGHAKNDECKLSQTSDKRAVHKEVEHE
jgi:hypothetical protein